MDMPLQMSAFMASFKVTQKSIRKAVDSLGIQPSSNMGFVDRRAVRVAAVQYEMESYSSLRDFVADVNDYMAKAVKDGAQLVVFPEGMGFASLPLVPMYSSIRSRLKGAAQEDKLEAMEEISDALIDYFYEVYSTLFSELARAHRVYLAAGSIYVFEDDSLRSRAFLYDPSGKEISWQDKLFPSGEELDMGMQGGESVNVAKTPLGGIAMLIGQDDEYYEPFKIASLTGADLVAFSSAYRGRPDKFRAMGTIAARAYECGLYCIRSAMVGRYVTGEKLNDHAGIYGPYASARGEHGVITEAPADGKGHVISARLDLQRLQDAMDGYNSYSNEALAAQYGDLFSQDPLPLAPSEGQA